VIPPTGTAEKVVIASPWLTAGGPPVRPVQTAGTLTKVEGNTLTIHGHQPGEGVVDVALAIDKTAQFQIDGEPGELKDLKPGMDLRALPMPPGANPPKALMIQATSRGRRGTVAGIDGREKQLILDMFNQEMGIPIDEKTKVIFPGVVTDDGRSIHFRKSTFGGLRDLKIGTRVTVLPETGTAEKILVGR
jgi:hypothetical protein